MRIGGQYIELDALFWSEHWLPRPTEQFIDLVRQASANERWVADGNYSVAREVLWPRATHVIWLNFNRSLVFVRLLRRTVRRALRREVLWHGNQESFSKAFLSRESILWWSLTTFAKNRVRYAELRATASYPQLQWVEFTSPSQASSYLRTYESAA